MVGIVHATGVTDRLDKKEGSELGKGHLQRCPAAKEKIIGSGMMPKYNWYRNGLRDERGNRTNEL